MIARLAAVLALAGCDVVAGLDELPTADLAPGCSGTRLLRTFGDGALDPVWVPSVDVTHGSYVTTADQIAFSFTGFAREAISSVTSFDLRDDAVSVGVTADSGSPDAELDLYASNSAASLQLTNQNGTLHFTVRDETGAGADVSTLLYDPVAHRYWRISQVGGETRWETSPDDRSWVVRATAHLDWVAYVTVALAAMPSSVPSTTTFDHLNVGAAAGTVCRAALLVDDFDADTLAATWAPYTYSATITPGAGELAIAVDGTAGANGYIVSSTIYDLRESAFAVHVANMPSAQTDGTVQLTLGTIPSTYVVFQQVRGTLTAIDSTLGAVGSTSWDASTGSWWRLRGAKGVLYLEISGDGRTYTEVGETHELSLDRARVSLQLTGGTANMVTFDHFNVPP